jgi:hypothetical protein
MVIPRSVEFSADNEKYLQHWRRLSFACSLNRTEEASTLKMALKSETLGSYGRNAGEHRVRRLPTRAASPPSPTVFQPRLSVRGRDPHDCSDASYVGGCDDGRPGFRTDRPRFRVRGDCGPDRRPSLDGADGYGRNIQPGLAEIARHDHRAKAKVEGGARQRRPYVDVEDPGSADRARREVDRAAVDRGASLFGLHGYGPGTLRPGDRQAQYKEE